MSRRVPAVRGARAADELGAHVSSAGGVQHAPARAAQLGAVVLQLFTKQPSRWAEPELTAEAVAGFREARERHGIVMAAAHDSYLINLATPDPALYQRSCESFRQELERCVALGIECLVTHPGNATDGGLQRGLAQNGEAIERGLEEVGGTTMVLLETTAGAGRVLGSSFEEIAAIIERVRPALRSRMGVCLDTCHVWAAGYDLRHDYQGVLARFGDVIGLDRLRLLHLNDSLAPRGSRRDRHAAIGAGSLGPAPFRQLVRDERLMPIPKLLETPKGEDPLASDRRNLRRLRRYRSRGA